MDDHIVTLDVFAEIDVPSHAGKRSLGERNHSLLGTSSRSETKRSILERDLHRNEFNSRDAELFATEQISSDIP